MNTVELPLADGRVTLVDEDVAQSLSGTSIHHFAKNYVEVSENGNTQLLHRRIMNPPKGLVVDHMNGNPLDNRRENLRVVTQSENSMNKRSKPRGRSGYRWVYWIGDRRKWELLYHLHRRKVYFGRWRSRHVAAFFADELRIEIIGDFAPRNFERDICRDRLRVFLEGTRGRIFRVVFSRRADGRQREMVCRIGVTKHLKGQGPAYCAADHDLMSVYDVQKREYRSIPLDRVLCVRFGRTNYRVIS